MIIFSVDESKIRSEIRGKEWKNNIRRVLFPIQICQFWDTGLRLLFDECPHAPDNVYGNTPYDTHNPIPGIIMITESSNRGRLLIHGAVLAFRQFPGRRATETVLILEILGAICRFDVRNGCDWLYRLPELLQFMREKGVK